MPEPIAVLKPKLPETPQIVGYLQQIDQNRWYGNHGPLVKAFEARVAEFLNAKDGQVIMVANGTLGLTVALQALEVPRGSHCLMPSWTFTATPAAALAAGLNPVFMDVEEKPQTITPESVKAAMKQSKHPIGVVLPVASFGVPLDVAAWDRFTEETGIPVVIDAAATFDSFARGSMKVGRTPVMVSLHATKICGIGEGGLVLTTSSDIAFRISRIINFGFENDRLSHRVAINAKPSEYNAAVGMAVLDQWPEIRAAWARVHNGYLNAFGEHGIACWMHPDWVTSTCNILVPHRAVEVATRLKEKAIDTRRWWETGCHVHPAYRGFSIAGELPVTQYLGQTMLGLPAAMDLSEDQQRRVCDSVIEIVRALKEKEAAA